MKTSKKLLVKLLKNNGDSMEKWFLYDKDRNPLNKTVERDSLLLKGDFIYLYMLGLNVKINI